MAHMTYAGAFATESEKRAAAILAKLPDDWMVICNKMLATHGRTAEIDFIIIGHCLVFLLDEKSWVDAITGTDQYWNFPNGNSVKSPINKVDYVARPLAGHLRAKVPSLPTGHFVHAGVLLTAAQQLPRLSDPRLNDHVFLGANVNDRLITLDQQPRRVLGAQNRTAIHTCLYDLGNRPATPSRIHEYAIIDSSDGPAGSKVFQATLKGEPRTLMVYDLTKSDDRAAGLAFYDREFQALHDLRATQVVAECHDPCMWSEDFRILPIIPPPGTTLAAIPMPETSVDLHDELLRAQACFESLHIIHGKNVIHRAITPSAIVIQGNGKGQKAIFTHFYAARIEEQSIAPHLDLLALTDPYAHPSLAFSYGQATRATDQYSLALLFLERISRRSVTDLRRDTQALPNLYTRWSSAPQHVIEELTELFASLLNGDLEKPRDAQTVGGIFGDLAARLKSNDQPLEQILDQRYKVQRLLGKGATAQTYLVTDVHFPDLGLWAVKQFQHAADVLVHAQAEFNALKHIINTKYLPKIFDIAPPDKQAHVKMEYIPGQTLEELQSEFPWPLDRWWKLADHLLNALCELEEHHLLHRDVKPANIIFDTTKDRFVLIDFGFSLGVRQAAPPAGTPLYWPPEAQTSATPPPSCDRYALAIVLFRALTGVLPFVGSDKRQLETPFLTDPRAQRLAKVLLDALSPDPAARPQTAELLRDQLSAAIRTSEVPSATTAQLHPQINPWVDCVRGLIRTSISGNSDNRGLDSEFLRNTYVPTALDTRLLPAILHHRPNVVFLSGNPGDGKTAFLEQVRRWLLEHEAHEVVRNPSGWEYLLDSHHYRSCYDASESHEGLSADQQLAAKLAGFEGKHLPKLALTVLVAINDGRLADFLERHADTFGAIKQQVEHTRTRGTRPEDPVWLIDLKQRAFIALKPTAPPTIARQVLTTLVNPARWSICDACSAHPICPITANAHALRQAQVAQRLEQLLVLAHLRRQRHITMRDLRSTLALLMTGNLACTDIHTAHEQGHLADAFRSLPYWQAIFTTTDGSDELLGDLAMLDPARQPHPGLDRFFHYHQNPQATIRRQLFVDDQDLPRTQFASEREWIAALKRRLYFMSANESLPTSVVPLVRPARLLPYRYTEQYIALLCGTADTTLLRKHIARGLLRSDGLPLSGAADKLSLRVAYSEQQQLAVIKQFPLDQFVLEVPQPQHSAWVESIPELVIFRHRSGTPRIELSLDLFELLMRLADGADPQSEEYKPLLEELLPFKSALLLREANELVLIEAQRRIYTVTQQDTHILLHAHQEQGDES